MIYDIDEFAKGCILCAVFKHSSTGKGEIGVPRKVLNPRHTWQMDIVNGMGQVKGYIAYITFVDVYSGYVVPVALKSETSAAIAQAIEKSIIKVFGPPDSISSDNAANLSGIEIRKLLAFYNINRQYTTPYAPESHGLVENCNRFITQLTRIYSDQFRAPWIDVLTLAAVTINSVPRQSLNHHSPHFIMFNEEPAQQLDQTNFLNTDAVIEKATNNKVFAKPLREYLLLQRQRQNAKLGRPYLSFPPGTLIYSKDFSAKTSNKKTKLVYKKSPEKVISEYRTLVYSSDIFNRIRKRSKNNIKIASPRSVELFGSLPVHIQMILGSPMTPDIWDKIKDSDTVPAYLNHIDIDFDNAQRLRGHLPDDSHVLELDLTADVIADEEGDNEIFSDLSSGFVEKLAYLHNTQNLTADINLSKVTPLFDKVSKEPGAKILVPLSILVSPATELPRATLDDAGGINVANILPNRLRVRFADN